MSRNILLHLHCYRPNYYFWSATLSLLVMIHYYQGKLHHEYRHKTIYCPTIPKRHFRLKNNKYLQVYIIDRLEEKTDEGRTFTSKDILVKVKRTYQTYVLLTYVCNYLIVSLAFVSRYLKHIYLVCIVLILIVVAK